MGFIFLCLNIIATLIGKGSILAFSYGHSTITIVDFTVAIYWICFYLLPQLIMALGVLIMSIGLKGTLKIMYKFPPIILTPIFSIWTIGPIMPTSICGSSYNNG